MRKNTPEDFWNKLESYGECLVWPLSKTHNGYGLVHYQGKQYRAHRLAWTLSFGDIPEGLSVLHKCDNPPCCNPNHLFLGTQLDNIKDMYNKGRGLLGRSGTPFSDEAKSKSKKSALARWEKMTEEERKTIGAAMGQSRAGKKRGPYKGREAYAKGYKGIE